MNTTVTVNGTPSINVTSSTEASVSVSISASALVEPSVSVSVEESSINVATSVDPDISVISSVTVTPISVSVEERTIAVGIAPTSPSVFVSSQAQGARGPAGPMGTVEGFEAISLNILSYNKTYNWTGDIINSIDYETPSGTITKTYSYTSGNVTSVTLSGAIPSGFPITKTYTYDGSGNIISTNYS